MEADLRELQDHLLLQPQPVDENAQIIKKGGKIMPQAQQKFETDENPFIKSFKLINQQKSGKTPTNQENPAERSRSDLRHKNSRLDCKMFQNALFFQLEAFSSYSKIRLYGYNTTQKHDFSLEYYFVLDTTQNVQEIISNNNELTYRQKLKCLEYFRTGNRCFLSKDFLTASESFKHAIQTFSGFHSCYNSLAYIQYLQHRNQAAIKYIQSAITLDPKNANLWNNMALQYVDSDVNKAISYFNQSMAIRPTFTALSNLGTLYFQLGTYKKAEDYFHRSIQTQKTERAVLGSAVTYCHQKRQFLCQDFFSQALNNNDSSKILLTYLGHAELKHNNLEAAYTYFKQGLDTYPNQPDFFNGLGNYYLKKKQYTKSLLQYDKAIKIRNEARYQTNYILCLIKSKKTAQAVERLYQAINSDDLQGSLNIHEILTLMVQRRHTYMFVMNILNYILPYCYKKQRKYLHMVLNFKASLHAKIKENRQSLECLLEVQKLSPQPKIMLNIAIIMYKLKKIKQSLQYLHKAIEADPNYLEPYYHLGAFLAYQKNYSEALIYFKKYLKLHKNEKVLNALGVVHFNLKNYKQAYLCVKQALRINPKYTPAQNNIKLIPYNDKTNLQISNNSLLNKFPLSFFNRANELAREKDFDKAQQLYLKALQSSTNLCQIYHNLALVQLQRGKSQEGLANFIGAIQNNYQSYKSCIQFSLYTEIYKRKDYWLKIVNRMRNLECPNYKIHLNIALMSKIAKEKLEYKKYLQLSFWHFIQVDNFTQDKNQITGRIQHYQQVADRLAKVCKQYQFMDFTLMLGLLYEKAGLKSKAEQSAIKYLNYFKLKRQSLFDTFFSVVKTELPYYKLITQNTLLNLFIQSILSYNQDQATLCYFKLKNIFPLFTFSQLVQDKIHQRKLNIINQVNYYLSWLNNTNNPQKIQHFKEANQRIDKILKIVQSLQNQSKQAEQDTTQKQFQGINSAYKRLVIKSKLTKIEDGKKLKRYYKSYRKQAAKLKEQTKQFLVDSSHNHPQPNRLLYFRTKLLQLELSKFINNKLLTFTFYNIQKEKINRIMIKVTQGHYNNSFQSALAEILNSFSQLNVQASSFCSFSNLYLQRSQQNQLQSILNHQEINKPSTKVPLKITNLRIDPKIIQPIQKQQQSKQNIQSIRNLKEQVVKRVVIHQNEQRILKKCSSMPTFSSNKCQLKNEKGMFQQQFEYKIRKRGALMRKLSCHSAAILFIQNQEESQQQQPKHLLIQNSKQIILHRRIITLQAAKSVRHILFLKKLLYFSKIALVEEFALLFSSSFIQVSVNPQKKSTGKPINIKKASNCRQYEYYIRDSGLNLKQALIKSGKKECFELLKKAALVLVAIQQQGIHCVSLNLGKFILFENKMAYNQVESMYRVQSRDTRQSHKLIKNLVGYWLTMESNAFTDQLMTKYLFKGLSRIRINELFMWKNRFQNSSNKDRQFQQNLRVLMEQLWVAAKRDHINLFAQIMKQVFELKYGLFEKSEKQQLLAVFEDYEIQNEPLRILIARLSTIEHENYKQLKEIMHYLGEQVCSVGS